MIDEVARSYKLHMSCSIHIENFVSFELEVSLQRLCESNIMGWTSPISLVIFLVRSSIHSSCSFASSSSSSSESSALTALLFLTRETRKKTCDLLASNIRKPSMFLAFLIVWDTLLALTLWPVCSPRSNNLRYCFWLYLNLFLGTADDLSPQPLDGKSITFYKIREVPRSSRGWLSRPTLPWTSLVAYDCIGLSRSVSYSSAYLCFATSRDENRWNDLT